MFKGSLLSRALMLKQFPLQIGIVGLTNVITCAKIGFKISIGFSRPTGGKTQVSL